ncbi:MAG: leucine-rich repeat protein [Anaerostipes hadrus]
MIRNSLRRSFGCKGLYSVDSKYKTIEAGAFYGNTSITDIELGRNITKLNNNSLAFSSNISSISSTSSKLQIDANLLVILRMVLSS